MVNPAYLASQPVLRLPNVALVKLSVYAEQDHMAARTYPSGPLVGAMEEKHKDSFHPPYLFACREESQEAKASSNSVNVIRVAAGGHMAMALILEHSFPTVYTN